MMHVKSAVSLARTISFRGMVIIFLSTLLIACSDPPSTLKYGLPTKLQAEERPMDRLCAIQSAFLNLASPIEESISHVPAWDETPMFAAKTHYSEFHSVKLAPNALLFLEQHSIPELVVSLLPLMMEEKAGRQPLIFLAGIPFSSKNEKRLYTGVMANVLVNRKRQDRLIWRQKLGDPARLVGPIYSTKFFQMPQTEAEDYRQTLEFHIRHIVDEFRSLPFSPLTEDDHRQHDINTKTRYFIDRNLNNPLAPLAILPLMKSAPSPAQISQSEVVMLLLLGLDEKRVIDAFINPQTEESIVALKERYLQPAINPCKG